ncbi:hypothetical protein [Streptomyces sp. NPDC006879]|uniref:hypothetical protein n=1 Tax=Streptomyces sp. NPDC006879 TaxID=3364767 RepID=UPI0036CC99EE
MNNSPTFGGQSPTSAASPRTLHHLRDVPRQVLSTSQLRAHGISAALTSERCRPGGPWQQVLPGVFLLHPGPPTSEERLHAVLLYAGRPSDTLVPPQPSYRDAVISGLAALTLHGLVSAPPLPSLDRIDVLVPHARRTRSTGCAHLVRTHAMPVPQDVTGLPVAPVARALADAVGQLPDAGTVRRLLTEAVRGGHCEAAVVVRELTQARLLHLPHVVDAVDSLLEEGRAIAEDRLYDLVRTHGLPDPLWNVDLRLPGGPHLGGVDAFWPDQGVAVELDTRGGDHGAGATGQEQWSEVARKREHLERSGITVVHLTPRKLREAPEQQVAVLGTALAEAAERDPASYLVVLPR